MHIQKSCDLYCTFMVSLSLQRFVKWHDRLWSISEAVVQDSLLGFYLIAVYDPATFLRWQQSGALGREWPQVCQYGQFRISRIHPKCVSMRTIYATLVDTSEQRLWGFWNDRRVSIIIKYLTTVYFYSMSSEISNDHVLLKLNHAWHFYHCPSLY